MIDVTPIVNAVIVLLAAIITIIIIPYIRSKTTENQRAQIQTLINVAVYAAEQLCKEPGSGEQKKSYVLGFLEERGVTYDASAIDTMIEAAVKKLNIEQGAA
jgi:hypothetical protein